MTLAGGTLPRNRPTRNVERAAPAKKMRPDPDRLLAWYDRARRALPWRALPGEACDPYRVWLSEIMLQQTTVKAVVPYYARFLARWPTVEALAFAHIEDVLREWAGLGYYARARNLHACAKALVARHGGVFPSEASALRALPGIGAYTAAAIAAIAFDRPALPVDGNVERVAARLFAVTDELPAGKAAIARAAGLLMPQERFGDFAQALMDLGATVCTPRNPACGACPWSGQCAAHAQGIAHELPRRGAKMEPKLRRGSAFVVMRTDGRVLLRTRPQRGLLGGMTEVPTTEWSPDFDPEVALAQSPRLGARALRWERLSGVVRHVFTHFPLELTVYRAEVSASTRAPVGMRFVAMSDLSTEALPNLMRKVLAQAGLNTERRLR